MRAGDGVREVGFDGIVHLDTPHSFIPQGDSVWEMGVNADPLRKANGDYRTRTDKPLTVTPAETTFVFVTPRRWPEKGEWIQRRLAENVWRDVRVLDADDLESWLSTAPAVDTWLAPLVGHLTVGVSTVEQFWSQWSEATNPPFTPEVLTVGWKDDPVSTLRTFLAAEPGARGLSGESPQMAEAFIAATLMAWPGVEGEQVRARTLFVGQESAWTNAVVQGKSSILVPLFPQRSHVTSAVHQGHHVLVPLGRRDGSIRQVIVLSRQQRRVLREALVRMGVPETQLESLATLGRRSLLALRRRLAHLEAVHTPPWAGQNLVAPMLAGAWIDTQSGDQQALAQLAGEQDYAAVQRAVIGLAQQNEPPLRRTGSSWLLTSKEDAWTLLAPTLMEANLNRLVNVVQTVLGTVDPALALPAEQRPMAALYGKVHPYSELLREELADTLALMGARSADTSWYLLESPQTYVDQIVRSLLSTRTTDAWTSLAPAFPQLAEAAPDVFLTAVEQALASGTPSLVDLFQDAKSQVFGHSSPHIFLLLALEGLAWLPTFFSRATLLLGRLSDLDPGGQTLNRPSNSLAEVFSPWLRNTDVGVADKLRGVDVLREQLPDVGWRLMLALVVTDGVSGRTRTPNWRDWGQDLPWQLPEEQIIEMLAEIRNRLLQDAGGCSDRLLGLLQEYRHFDPLQQDTLCQAIHTAAQAPDAQTVIWEALREFVASQYEFPTAHWAITGGPLQKLEQLRDQLQPTDVIAKNKWVFSQSPTLGLQTHPIDFGKHHELWMQAQTTAVADVLASAQADGIQSLLENSDPSAAQAIGQAVGRLPHTLFNDPQSLLTFIQTSPQGAGFAAGLLLAWRFSQRRKEITALLTRPEFTARAAAEQAFLLQALPADTETWSLVQSLGGEVAQAYWQQVSVFEVGRESTEAAEEAYRQFRTYEQHTTAFYLAQLRSLDLPGHEWLSLLEAFEEQDAAFVRDQAHHIRELLEELAERTDVDQSKLAQTAWAYLPLYGYSQAPAALNQALLADPELYATIFLTAFPGAAGQSDEDQEGKKRRERAAHLLWMLRGVPGTANGQLPDEATLHAWYTAVQARLKAQDRGRIGDSQIGQLLATAPAQDGQWPPPVVCTLIEFAKSEALEDGFRLGRYNLRGGTNRDLDSGGDLERELVAQYQQQAQTVEARWPRTAQCLRELAQMYEQEARRHDDDAELTQDRWT
ncbi:hypothetical protein GO986_12085 [Deinococcus sp. HMF7620]|uniref:Uncharacterized protein n=1 Tax=Deinococcus arboris TaxID=2682977 RepID=A0A7C9MRU4_9DEIO|nr:MULTISPECIES: hypothetical protein [Deinococcus]MBZ9752144.1 hypothetical protein [Deinococcus betulae]MVN87504.1 hypothetical protein [Deinococcus arboris]